MKIMIVGCGRLGASLALALYRKGHLVTVIDKNSKSFNMLGSEFNGNTITGLGFDKNVLEEAGIEYQDVLIACTSSDETNALIAKIAKDIYFVGKVLVRLYDPELARIFSSLGIKTISTTGFGVDRVLELLSLGHIDSLVSLGEEANTEIVRIVATGEVEGASVGELQKDQEYHLISIVRGDKSFIPGEKEIVQTGDILYFVVQSDKANGLKRALGL